MPGRAPNTSLGSWSLDRWHSRLGEFYEAWSRKEASKQARLPLWVCFGVEGITWTFSGVIERISLLYAR